MESKSLLSTFHDIVSFISGVVDSIITCPINVMPSDSTMVEIYQRVEKEIVDHCSKRDYNQILNRQLLVFICFDFFV
jgi:hypothetical protein